MNLNSLQPDFDWHEHGLWIAAHPVNGPDPQFVATTPWTCRGEALRGLNQRWSVLVEQGWFIQKFVAAVAPPVMRITEQAVSNESHWRYPANGDIPPRGVGLCLLTIGKVQVIGDWTDDGGFIAWAPKIRRDKELEERPG